MNDTSSNLLVSTQLSSSDIFDTPSLQNLLDGYQLDRIELDIELIKENLNESNSSSSNLEHLTAPSQFQNNEINPQSQQDDLIFLQNIDLTDSSSNYVINSVESTFENQIRVMKKRGRKRKNENTVTINRLASRQKKIEKIKSQGGHPVCFGNKVVDRNSQQYLIERKRNNDAVMKLRQDQLEKMKLKDERIESLELQLIQKNSIIENLQHELYSYQIKYQPN